QVYGPYKEDNAYKLAKVDDLRKLPDSVQARHILINPETCGGYEKALSLADSLKNVIEKGASFAATAKAHSEDSGSAARGGDVGWFRRNQMVKPFEEVCFNGKVNSIYTVTTQFGVHLVQLTRKGKEVPQVRLAILTRNVEPSTQTYQQVYARASKFASESQNGPAFQEAVKVQDMNKHVAMVEENDQEVFGLEQSRSLVRAAFAAKPNTVLENHEGSTIFEFGNTFVIATLTKVREEGVSSFEAVKPRIELAVIRQKKAAMLQGKVNQVAANKQDMEAIAAELNTEVRDVNGINFSMFTIPSIGVEPAVTGAVSALEPDQLSAPVKGNTGVYLIKLISLSEPEAENLLPADEQQRLMQSLSYRANIQSYEAHRQQAEIEDKRAKFY
ncbi:MAG: peptidylprolyl isomerase, partial [Mangrovibacterium sp.]